MKAAIFTTALLTAIGATATVPCTGTTTLRDEAAKKKILFGSGMINPHWLNETMFAAVLAEQFNSLSPENELKWSFIHPTKDTYNWESIDRLVGFAEQHNMAMKGHGLISNCCNPDYLVNITDPSAFRAEMAAHFKAVLERYAGKIDRWDVVAEALKTNGGGLQTNNDFYKVLGPSYIEDAFRMARAASPDAKLLLNENLVESNPAKRQELYDLVSGLVADGVPIDGVALQMHITEVLPEAGVITDMVNSYKALGLDVTIAEMDVHTLDSTKQAVIYGAVIDEALHAGITDIHFWGFTDEHNYTWVDHAGPLMFDKQYHAKPAFYATHDALAKFVN
ncbi:hypothetical protein ACQRIT_005765 [Beauveria bassiana]